MPKQYRNGRPKRPGAGNNYAGESRVFNQFSLVRGVKESAAIALQNSVWMALAATGRRAHWTIRDPKNLDMVVGDPDDINAAYRRAGKQATRSSGSAIATIRDGAPGYGKAQRTKLAIVRYENPGQHMVSAHLRAIFDPAEEANQTLAHDQAVARKELQTSFASPIDVPLTSPYITLAVASPEYIVANRDDTSQFLQRLSSTLIPSLNLRQLTSNRRNVGNLPWQTYYERRNSYGPESAAQLQACAEQLGLLATGGALAYNRK